MDAPEPLSTVQVLRVPWDSEYRNVVGWTVEERDAWFDAQLALGSDYWKIRSDFSYLPQGRPIMVDMPVNAVQSHNYMVVKNRQIGDREISLCYFILHADYVAPNTTAVFVQLDVWQTYRNDCEFGRCFIERGHIAVADKAGQLTDWSRGLALTAPEGLDTGGNTVITANTYLPLVDNDVCVMVTSSIDITADPGTVENPKIVMASGTNWELGADGTGVYMFANIADFTEFRSWLKSYPWVAQGITSITAIPDRLVNDANEHSTTIRANSAFNVMRFTQTMKRRVPDFYDQNIPELANFRDRFRVPGRYRHLKKFLQFPYAYIEMTAFTGASVVIQPELIGTANLLLARMVSLAPTSPRATFYLQGYGTLLAGNATSPIGSMYSPNLPARPDDGEGLNHGLTIDSFPRFAIYSNGGLMYMASNAHSLQAQRNSTQWGMNKGLAGNELAYGQASQNMTTTQQLNDIAIQAMDQQRALSNTTAGLNAGVNAISSLASGNVLGALSSAASYGINVYSNNEQFGIQSSQMNATTGANLENAAYMRDTNRQYGDMAAKGDYQYAIAAINAKVQDSLLQSPYAAGASGGDTLNYMYGYLGIALRYRQIPPHAMRQIGEYWLMYGYAVQLWAIPPYDLQCMTRFTYWKMKDSQVFSRAAPEEYVQTIRGIVENGVTVWRDPGDIGRIDAAENEPIVTTYLPTAVV